MPAPTPDWSPFVMLPAGQRTAPPRKLSRPGGVGDRLRAAAFAELQAREAFAWAAEHFVDAPENLRGTWRNLSIAEQRHLGWLLDRMEELGVDVAERPVSDALWHALTSCEDAEQFSRWMADAEERGRAAGLKIGRKLSGVDAVTARIFETIAEEEVAHVAVARRYFGHVATP